GAAMRDAFSLVPPYIRTEGNSAGVLGPPWFSEYGVQQTRGFRALKVWMTLKLHGVAGYRRGVAHHPPPGGPPPPPRPRGGDPPRPPVAGPPRRPGPRV